MYKGKNPTALQSQQWIVDSLIELMRKRPYQQITIKNICKEADLSRQTFYNIFESKEEILRFCLQRKYEAQFIHISEKETVSISELMKAFAYVLEEDKEVLQLMIDNHLDSIVSDEIAKCISLFAENMVKKEKNEFLEYSEILLGGALSYLLVYWFRQKEQISIDKITYIVEEFLKGNLYTL